MLEMVWTWQYILGLLAIGFFVWFGGTIGAWLAGAILGLLKRGG